MKKRWIVDIFTALVVLTSVTAGPCRAESDKDKIMAMAESMQRSFMSGDLETFMRYTYPPLIEKMGGKDKMLTALKQGRDEMRTKGISLDSVEASEPGEIVPGGKRLFTLVPMTIVMKVRGGTLTHHGYNLGISDDGGKNWSFIDTVRANSPEFKEMVPDLPSNIAIPRPQQPEFNSAKGK